MLKPLLALAAFALLASLPVQDHAPRFTLGAAEGAAFAGAYDLNEYLLDAPRPASVRVSGGAEPSILLDRFGDDIWIGDTSGLYYSSNNGATWTRATNPFLPSVVGDGWALAQGDDGTLFVSTTIGPTSPVAWSEDGGRSWAGISHVNGIDSISDRPWLAARGANEVSLVVNGDRGEECYRSTDNGATWTSVAVVNTGSPNAGNLVYDSAGRLWFHNGAQLWRWSTPCLNAPTIEDARASGPALFTQVDVDAQDRVYFAEATPDSTQMKLFGWARGAGVNKSLAVSAPALRSNSFPTLSVLDADTIAVSWYGSETAGNPSSATFPGSWNVYVSIVHGFWTASPSVTTTRLTTEPNHVGGFCMGGVGCDLGQTPGDRDLLDYYMVDFDTDGTLHVAYGHDGATPNSEVRYARLP